MTTLDDDNYLDLDLIANNTMDPSSSTTHIQSIAIQLHYSDSEYKYRTLKNEYYDFLTSYNTIVQVFSIEQTDLKLTLLFDIVELRILFINTKTRKKQLRLRRSIFSRGKFYGDYKDTVCFGTQECLNEGILYPYNRKCNKRLCYRYSYKQFYVYRESDTHFTVVDNWDNRNKYSLPVKIAFLKGFNVRE